MICPFCGNPESLVIHTEKFRSVVRRVRACQQCGMPWRTFESNPICGCGHIDSDVISSEKYDETVRRTRRCGDCKRNWKTYETVIDEYGVIDFEPHIIDEEKIKKGMRPDNATSTTI